MSQTLTVKTLPRTYNTLVHRAVKRTVASYCPCQSPAQQWGGCTKLSEPRRIFSLPCRSSDTKKAGTPALWTSLPLTSKGQSWQGGGMEVLLPALPLHCLLKTPTGHSLLVCIECFLHLCTSQTRGGHRETRTLRAPHQKRSLAAVDLQPTQTGIGAGRHGRSTGTVY